MGPEEREGVDWGLGAQPALELSKGDRAGVSVPMGVLRVHTSVWVLHVRHPPPVPGDGTHLSVLALTALPWGTTAHRTTHTASSLQAGPPVCKPDVISHLERGEEPWQMPREVPGGAYLGEWGTQWGDMQAPGSQDHPTRCLHVVVLPCLPSAHAEHRLYVGNCGGNTAVS